MVVAAVVVVAAVSLIWVLRCVFIFLADVHWDFLVIVGVGGVVAAVFVLTLGFFVPDITGLVWYYCCIFGIAPKFYSVLLPRCRCGAAARAGHDCQERHRAASRISWARLPAAPPNHSQHVEYPAAAPLRAKLPSLLGETCLGVWVGCVSDTASTYAALHCQPARQRNAMRAHRLFTYPPPPYLPRFSAAKLSSLPFIVCPGLSPSAAAATFIPARVRSGLHASTHSGDAFRALPCTSVPGWRAITGTLCRRAPSAS